MRISENGADSDDSGVQSGWTVVDVQVPGRELVIVHRGTIAQGKSAARLRPSRLGEAAVQLSRRASEANHDIDETLVRRGVRERHCARVVRGADGVVHSVAVWVGPPESEPPEPPATGAWTWVLDSRTTYWSDSLYRMYGIERDGGRRHAVHQFLQMLNPADAVRVAQLFARVYDAEIHQFLGETFSIVTPNNTVRRLHALGRVIETSAGKRLWRGTSVDVTNYLADSPLVPTLIGIALPDPTGIQTALVELPRLRLLRWLSQGIPDVAWPVDGDLSTAISGEFIGTDGVDATKISAWSNDVPPAVAVILRALDGSFHEAQMTIQLLTEPSATTPALIVIQRVG